MLFDRHKESVRERDVGNRQKRRTWRNDCVGRPAVYLRILLAPFHTRWLLVVRNQFILVQEVYTLVLLRRLTADVARMRR